MGSGGGPGGARGGRVRLGASGQRSPPEATAGDREPLRVPQGWREGRPGCGGAVWGGSGGCPGARIPAAARCSQPSSSWGRNFRFNYSSAALGSPGPRPRPSYRPIAIKSVTRRAAAKRTRHPPGPRSPWRRAGDGSGMRAPTGVWGPLSLSPPRLPANSEAGRSGVPSPTWTLGTGGCPPPPIPLPTRCPSPGCVIFIFTFKFPLPSLSRPSPRARPLPGSFISAPSSFSSTPPRPLLSP